MMILLKTKNPKFFLRTLLCLSPLISLQAQDEIVIKSWGSPPGSMTEVWNDPNNWRPFTTPPTYPGQNPRPDNTPNMGGDIAIFDNRERSFPIITNAPGVNIVLGEILVNIPGGPFTFAVQPFSFTFNSGQICEPAFINVLQGNILITPPTPTSPLTLASNLIVNLANVPPNLAGITIGYSIQDTPGTSFDVTINAKPNAAATLSGINTNSGRYIFNGGTVNLASSGIAIPSTLQVNSGATASIQTVGVNQFAPTANVLLQGGTLNLNGSQVQAFNSLTIDSGGQALDDGFVNTPFPSSAATLTLNSGTTALNMKGGNVEISNLVLANGGAIAFTKSLQGSGNATIGFASHSSNIDLTGHTVNLAIDDGSASPHQLFDLAFINTQFIGGGGLNKINPGTVLFEGNNTLPSLTLNGGKVLIGRFGGEVTTLGNAQLIVNRGTTLGGFGTLGAGGTTLVTNSGTVEPGSEDQIGTFTISGSYHQNPCGTLFIKLANRSSDKLVVVGGDVALDGTLQLQGGNLHFNPGQRIVILDNTLGRGIQGSFHHFMEDISDNLLAKFLVTPKQVLLEFFTSPEPEIGAIESSQVIQLNGHNLNVISRLRAVRNRFGTLEWEEAEPKLQAEAEHPKKNILFKQSRNQAIALTSSEPEPEVISAGRFWKKPSDQPASLYIAPLGSWGDIDQIHMQPGFNFYSIGGLLGGDYAFNNAGVGALLGYERVHGTIDDHFGNFHYNSLFGQAYGTFLPLKNRNFFLDLIAGGSRNWYTLNRQSNCAIAQGKPRGWEYDGYAGLGYDIHMKKEWRLTPILGIQYMHLKIDDFTEEGACDENLFVCEQKIHSLRSWTGLSFGGKLLRDKVIWMPEVRGYWQHEFAKTSHCLGVCAPCLGFSESIKIFSSDRNYGIVGAELRALFGLKNRWTLAGAYDYYWSQSTQINYLYAELGFNF